MPRFSCSIKMMWLMAERSRGTVDSKTTETLTLPFTVTWQLEASPLQPSPDQLLIAKSWPGLAVNRTTVPLLKDALQVSLLQSRPAGLLLTVPVPEISTVS